MNLNMMPRSPRLSTRLGTNEKEIVEVDKARGVFRVTTSDERFYMRPSKNATTGLPEYEFVPSVTYITSFYPKGAQLTKWIADQGWDEAEAKKKEAGERGSRIHQAVAVLVAGGRLPRIGHTKGRN